MTDGKLLTCHKLWRQRYRKLDWPESKSRSVMAKRQKNNTVFWDRQSLALFLSLNTVSISFTVQFYFLSSPIVDECPSKRILHTRAFTNVSDSCRLHSFASERPLQTSRHTERRGEGRILLTRYTWTWTCKQLVWKKLISSDKYGFV